MTSDEEKNGQKLGGDVRGRYKDEGRKISTPVTVIQPQAQPKWVAKKLGRSKPDAEGGCGKGSFARGEKRVATKVESFPAEKRKVQSQINVGERRAGCNGGSSPWGTERFFRTRKHVSPIGGGVTLARG